MNKYFKWNTQTIFDFSDENIISQYNNGYVFTRINKGVMNQTRSIRINLNNFFLTSENRRVLSKTGKLDIEIIPLPFDINNYDWSIQKLAKEYYETKFGRKVFSVNKIKELLTSTNSNYNYLLRYKDINSELVGYAIVYMNNEILHYAYPFYNLSKYRNNYGMSMMLHTILISKDNKLKYIYLGSATKPQDRYKILFKSLEWYNRNNWSNDIDNLKSIINHE